MQRSYLALRKTELAHILHIHPTTLRAWQAKPKNGSHFTELDFPALAAQRLVWFCRYQKSLGKKGSKLEGERLWLEALAGTLDDWLTFLDHATRKKLGYQLSRTMLNTAASLPTHSLLRKRILLVVMTSEIRCDVSEHMV